jgi:hypothetical protein
MKYLKWNQGATDSKSWVRFRYLLLISVTLMLEESILNEYIIDIKHILKLYIFSCQNIYIINNK